MISEDTLTILSEKVALANNAAFLWRQLSPRPTVISLSDKRSDAELKDELVHILEGDIGELDLTMAYCLLVALLLKDRNAAQRASQIEGIDRLPLGRPLIESQSRPRGISSSSIVVPDHPRRAAPRNPSTATTTEQRGNTHS